MNRSVNNKNNKKKKIKDNKSKNNYKRNDNSSKKNTVEKNNVKLNVDNVLSKDINADEKIVRHNKEMRKNNDIKEKIIEKPKKNNQLVRIDLAIILFTFLFFFSFIYIAYTLNDVKIEPVKVYMVDNPVPIPKEKTIELTFAGDCTLGADTNFGYYGHFDWWLKNKANGDYGYFFEKVKYLFSDDDYSVVNLEGPITNYKKKTPKKFNFRADPSYTNILKLGGIDGVNLANNHSNDYGMTGYNDTKKNLDDASIDYFGYENVLIKEIKGKKIGFVGTTYVGLWADSDKNMVARIKKLKEDGVDIVVAVMHWGIEYQHNVIDNQRISAHKAIDAGADFVIGSHSHCLQGMEMYKGKNIIYAIGNFVYGGHASPKAMARDALIVKVYFHYINDEFDNLSVKIIPCSISSTKSRNNYQPIVLEGKEKQRIIDLVNKYSINYKYTESEA